MYLIKQYNNLFRLLVCIVIGLGALYLLHTLAQDYMKIRQPAAKLARLFLGKRDLHSFIPHPHLDNMVININIIIFQSG